VAEGEGKEAFCKMALVCLPFLVCFATVLYRSLEIISCLKHADLCYHGNGVYYHGYGVPMATMLPVNHCFLHSVSGHLTFFVGNTFLIVIFDLLI
jgi:hypothetical protein